MIMYRTHCQCILDTAVTKKFEEVSMFCICIVYFRSLYELWLVVWWYVDVGMVDQWYGMVVWMVVWICYYVNFERELKIPVFLIFKYKVWVIRGTSFPEYEFSGIRLFFRNVNFAVYIFFRDLSYPGYEFSEIWVVRSTNLTELYCTGSFFFNPDIL